MPFFDEARTQLVNMLNAWSFAAAFPTGYGGTKAVTITDQWPVDLIDNMLGETGGLMTMPVVSVVLASADDSFRTLGGAYGSGPIAGTFTYATRVNGLFMVSAWADQQMGGADMVEKLAGQIEACCFVNREGLAALRHLRMNTSHQSYQAGPTLWRLDVTVEGDSLMSYYA